jgi:predicted MPP superfamily phosphohydrolase
MSIVQLTDIHMGPFMPREELAACVAAVNRLLPDLVALTGDFVSYHEEEVEPCVDVLAGLKARYGVYACLGNHDVYANAEKELARQFGLRGITLLRNDSRTVRIGNTSLNILGIEDLRSGEPDLLQALFTAASAPGEVQVLLSHRPEVFPAAAGRDVDLVLSGHYHGGQVKFLSPAGELSVARLLTPYAEGLFHLPRRSKDMAQPGKGATLFVSRGIGITGLPVRINCPPQVAHLILRRA